ncbi:MAG: phosphatase PAP2 family protein [Lachnospiraceae bacterium]|nr:phosphatase PAP2 family protein [Lachnospiraceae bacterium]
MGSGMTFYFDWEVRLMEWLQSGMGPFGVALAGFLTACGEEIVLILLLGYIYWCYDKEFGKFIGINIVVGLVWNTMLKNIVLRRRPYFDHAGIQCFKPVEPEADIYDISEQGFSFPSGHSTNAVLSYSSMPLYKKNRFLTVAAFVMPLLVGLSRVLLGVHYPTDVLCGWLMGAVIIFLNSFLQKKVQKKWKLYLFFFLSGVPGMFYCRTSDYYTCMGIMAGLFLAILFEEKYVHFEMTRSIPACIARLLGGFAVYFALNTLLKLPFPKELLISDTMTAYMIRFVRYIIVAFAALGVYPMLFGRFGKKARSGQGI